MPRPLLDEATITDPSLGTTDLRKRRDILRDTVASLDDPETRHRYHQRAVENHRRWKATASTTAFRSKQVRVVAGDWGEIAKELSQKSGHVYAVLNMANAYRPGGGYLDGKIAQEENMFRRTDCHFYIKDNEVQSSRPTHYTKAMTDLLHGENGRVYLDKSQPRVCIRGSEGPNVSGYDYYSPTDYFEFYELRAAADDLRPSGRRGAPKPFNKQSMQKKISAMLDTLVEAGIRHVVLSAFGCGAFANPADEVAQIFQEELAKRPDYFDEVVFAVYHAGYGPDNFTPFHQALDGLSLEGPAYQSRTTHREPQPVTTPVEPPQPPHPAPVERPATRRRSHHHHRHFVAPTPSPDDYSSEYRDELLGGILTALKTNVESPVWEQRGFVFIFFDMRKLARGIDQIRDALKMNVSDEQKFKKIQEIARDRLDNPPFFTKRDDKGQQLYRDIAALRLGSLNSDAFARFRNPDYNAQPALRNDPVR